jgi:hypothetical protein
MVAKRFFYICAGILCLAFAYHFGARSATAQGPLAFHLAWEGNPVVVTSQGDVYFHLLGCGNCATWQLQGNVFGGSPAGRTIVECDERVALASSGEVFFNPNANQGIGPWVNLGVPPFGATPATQTTWGQLKSRYR